MSTSQEEYWGMSEKTYCMLLHLSQFSSIVAPGLGLILPIIMWATNKDKSSAIDRHGKITINWIISLTIYFILCLILWVFIVGAIGFFVLILLNLIFAVIAAVKANDGELWVYPMSIKFLKYE